MVGTARGQQVNIQVNWFREFTYSSNSEGSLQVLGSSRKEQVVGHSSWTLGVNVGDSGSDPTAAWWPS